MKKNDKNGEKKALSVKITYYFVLASFIFTIGYLVAKFINAEHVPLDDDVRTKSDYILMFLETLLGLVVINVPNILEKKFRLVIPTVTTISYTVFLYCSIYLGEFRSFYYKIPFWDTILHGFSAGMLGIAGFSIVNYFNEKRIKAMSPFFVSLFAFCFAVTIGVLWEFYEFGADAVFKTNMQKYMAEGGVKLVGQEALFDTIKDLFIDVLGALIISVTGFVLLKKQKEGMDKILIKYKRAKANPVGDEAELSPEGLVAAADFDEESADETVSDAEGEVIKDELKR